MAELNVPASRPIDFGVCNGGKSVYQLLIWIDGEDAESVLPILTETEQYVLGIRSGEILRKIHSIPAPNTQEDWEVRFIGGEPQLEFFKLLTFYIASNTLSCIYWAIPFGQGEIDTMMRQTQDVLDWYDNMRNPVPTWYLKDFYIQYIDGVPLKAEKAV